MPVIEIIVNKPLDDKKALSKSITDLFAHEVRVPPGHVHTLILDNQYFAFGNDVDKTAVYVKVRSSAQQITAEARRTLVAELIPLLITAFPDLDAYRVNTMFEELPVENIAVGAHIAVFGAPPSTSSARNSLGGL
ncbi:hypothetical protein CHLRE_04g221400v5 [Chlamydomonas reinhardtii]|uniref:Uncharacterized protein n=1 Tax=Chlamydomonas reinhardtii TaxID=3055 RepID=A8ISV8_CHLRE|nr:uncharacterized protein CHLRE_04g221400v5 [Chlamydomonas reinhardtii]PNW84112.1 hypothetical protein CHLRE_04g221400v5 [Chlamydomonas reinhardtii]|eukprot:XP_001692276.1 predicted protein [Chlamydomonas reinhardtii]